MADINILTKEDFDEIFCKDGKPVCPENKKWDWDVVIEGVPWQVIKIKDFAHTIGGHLDWGDGNCFYAYRLDREFSFESLIPFDGQPGARWGFTYEPKSFIKHHMGDTYIERGRKLYITRNDEKFYSGFMTIHEAIAYVLDNKLDDHPLNLNSRDYDKKCIGRKVWYRSEPAVITSFIKGQACVILEPDGIEKFSIPAEFANEPCIDDEYCQSIKADIFSDHIYWFRRLEDSYGN